MINIPKNLQNKIEEISDERDSDDEIIRFALSFLKANIFDAFEE